MKDKTRKRRMIHKRIDGELNKSETHLFKKKILKDQEAREEYEQLKMVADTSKWLRKTPVPADFSGRIVRKIRKGRRRPF